MLYLIFSLLFIYFFGLPLYLIIGLAGSLVLIPIIIREIGQVFEEAGIIPSNAMLVVGITLAMLVTIFGGRPKTMWNLLVLKEEDNAK
jgi:hypothetical protein